MHSEEEEEWREWHVLVVCEYQSGETKWMMRTGIKDYSEPTLSGLLGTYVISTINC